MSETLFSSSFTVDDCPGLFPVESLVDAMHSLGVTFRRKGDALALTNGSRLTDEMKAAIAEHKTTLLALCDRLEGLNVELERLHVYVIRLRCSDPPKGSRAQAIRYQAQQIGKLAALSITFGGTEKGWYDPGDAFADGDQIIGLRAALDELEAGPYPIPLPAGCVLLPQTNFDVFAAGRLYNGMMKADVV